MGKSKSFTFDGGAATYVGTSILAFVVTVLSLGLAIPYAVVLRHRWRAKHTTIDGRRLAFLGTGMSLFGHWVLWWLLILVTLGVYTFWVVPRLTRWIVENTDFADLTRRPTTGSPAQPTSVAITRPAPPRVQPFAPSAPVVSTEVRYFRRRWDGSRGDEFDSWGSSDWYFEARSDGRVTRQVVVYDAGHTLRYDERYVTDRFGMLSEKALDLEGFSRYEVPRSTFESVWARPATNR